MTYGPKTYRKQGGDEFVVADGGSINIEAGGAFRLPLVTLGTSQVATSITGHGITTIVASTTAPEYTLAAPEVANQVCWINVVRNTSSGTAQVNSASTGIAFSSTGSNALTFNALEGVMLVAPSTSAWRVALWGGTPAFGAKTT